MNYIYSENHVKEIVKSYESGLTTYSIAETYNVWPNIILKILKEQGVKIRKRGHKKGNKGALKGIKKDTTSMSVKLIESGNFHHLSEAAIRKHVKRFLIHKNGHVCSICRQSKWNNQQIPLVCDHIDGDSNNSNLNNFRLVCCNCDAQLPTYKSKNKGNGRKYDRDYYNNTK
jgi:hypothetical protein